MSAKRRVRWTAAMALMTGLLASGLQAGSADARPGCAATVYWDANFGGESRTLHDSVAFVGHHWNDQISSIVVHQGHWVFFWDGGFAGEALPLNPGEYPYVGDHWNDQISSARCIAPTP